MSSDKNQEHYYRQIFKLGQIITSETNLDRLLPVIMEQINQIMQTQRCSVFLHDVDNDELYCQVSTDLKKDEIRISTSHGLAGWVFQNKTPAFRGMNCCKDAPPGSAKHTRLHGGYRSCSDV